MFFYISSTAAISSPGMAAAAHTVEIFLRLAGPHGMAAEEAASWQPRPALLRTGSAWLALHQSNEAARVHNAFSFAANTNTAAFKAHCHGLAAR